MAKESGHKCFIIMPITTPTETVETYRGDTEHFAHILECLFVPALEACDLIPISPRSTGSNVIQAEIIKHLSEADLVLCDISSLNPNVFFEFGIRTALNKPVALVVDDMTKHLPFDTSIIHFHKYKSSLDAWSIEEETKTLSKHIQSAFDKTPDHNALWKYFGIAQTGIFKPEDATTGEKLDLLANEVAALRKHIEIVPKGYDFLASPDFQELDNRTRVSTLVSLLSAASDPECASSRAARIMLAATGRKDPKKE
jgi:nucleoside 2-deoxyribosyltransferase